MKKILVTGGCGFIGSNFIKSVIKKDESIFIVNVDKLTYAGNLSNLQDISSSNFLHIKGDICDSELIYSIFKKYSFDAVVHFAAESHVDRSIDGPSNFVKTNIVGTMNLLENSRKFVTESKIEKFKFVHISTDEVYGSLTDGMKFVETTKYDPSSPYSASKAGADHLVRSWYRTFGLPTLITNCSNNYGPFQFPEKLIPLMIINAMMDKPLPIYGKGENIRDWLYVTDHCDAIWSVLNSGLVGETYNIGGDNEIKNIDIVTKICEILDDLLPRDDGKMHSESITFVKDRPGHDFRYAIDAKKIRTELGWKPKESFDTGIRKTIEWYLCNKSWWKAIQDQTYRQERLGTLNK